MLIKVKAFPSAKKVKIIKKDKDSFHICIKTKPVKGLANQAIRQVLSGYFQLPVSKIRLVKGFKQRNKIFEVD